MTPEPLPLWIEAIVAALLVCSAVFVLVAAWGLVRLKDFFQRMHPPALVFVWGSWCVSLASIIYFSALAHGPELHVWLIIILLSITVPITTALLARAALFRGRQARRGDLPPALQPRNASPASAPLKCASQSLRSTLTQPGCQDNSSRCVSGRPVRAANRRAKVLLPAPGLPTIRTCHTQHSG